jgi:hypothetical protein
MRPSPATGFQQRAHVVQKDQAAGPSISSMFFLVMKRICELHSDPRHAIRRLKNIAKNASTVHGMPLGAITYRDMDRDTPLNFVHEAKENGLAISR